MPDKARYDNQDRALGESLRKVRDDERASRADRRLEFHAGPCGDISSGQPTLTCSLPIGHQGLHECFVRMSWGACTGPEVVSDAR